MNGKLRDALNQLLGLIDNEILVFNKSLELSDISQAQYQIDKAVEAYEAANQIAKEAPTDASRNCDKFKSEYDSDKLHAAFIEHCNACDCPMGCIYRRDTRCMLDLRCGSILKCFAKFVLSEAKGVNDEQK